MWSFCAVYTCAETRQKRCLCTVAASLSSAKEVESQRGASQGWTRQEGEPRAAVAAAPTACVCMKCSMLRGESCCPSQAYVTHSLAQERLLLTECLTTDKCSWTLRVLANVKHARLPIQLSCEFTYKSLGD